MAADPMATVTVEECVAYMGGAVAARWKIGDEWPQIQDALDAETASQFKRVRRPVDDDDDPVAVPDLDNALKRRVVRNLGLRSIMNSAKQGDAGLGPLPVTGLDAEIRRLEGSYRRHPVR